MSDHQISYLGKRKFKAQNRQHVTYIDVPEDLLGEDSAPTPKEYLMNAMMGCTALDVVSILEKMRQKIGSLTVDIQVEKNKTPPVYFKTALMTFHVQGEIEKDKMIKSVVSSLTKYCGVNYMVSEVVDCSYTIILNGEQIYHASVDFVPPED